jgi:hypothetical protein
MLRLKPTAIVITTPEMADAERRSRYRKHLIKRQEGDRGHAKTSASKNEGVAFEDAIITMIQTDTDSDSGQASRSLSSPEMLAREERVPVISSPDGSIDGEAHTMPLRSRTQFDNMINDVIEQHEDEGDADRQQLATAVSWNFRQNWPSPRQQVFITAWNRTKTPWVSRGRQNNSRLIESPSSMYQYSYRSKNLNQPIFRGILMQ